MDNKEKKEGVFQHFFDSIRYMRESKKRRYSLDTYLDIVEEYADRIILDCKEKGYLYKGGNCRISVDINNSSQFLIGVKMYFKNKNADNIEKTAERYIDTKKFTTETIARIRENKELIFEIEKSINQEVD